MASNDKKDKKLPGPFDFTFSRRQVQRLKVALGWPIAFMEKEALRRRGDPDGAAAYQRSVDEDKTILDMFSAVLSAEPCCNCEDDRYVPCLRCSACPACCTCKPLSRPEPTLVVEGTGAKRLSRADILAWAKCELDVTVNDHTMQANFAGGRATTLRDLIKALEDDAPIATRGRRD